MLLNKLTFLTLCLVAGQTLAEKSYQGYKVLRLKPTTENQIKALEKIQDEFDFWTDIAIGRNVDIMASPQSESKLRDFLHQNLISDFSVMIENVGDLVERTKMAEKSEGNVKADHPMTWDSYHSLEDIWEYVYYLEATYPIVSLDIIGVSFENREIPVLKICRDGCDTGKPVLWVQGGTHAREWISHATVTYLLRYLIESLPAEDSDLLDVDWYVLPVVNPDGYKYTENGDRLWRKTRSKFGNQCDGADPNRNYDFHWDEGGSSDFSCSDSYHGVAPFSESEILALTSYIEANLLGRIQFFNDVHSYSQLILLPWAYSYTVPETFAEIEALAIKANDALMAVNGVPYEVGQISYLLSPSSGSSIDWFLGVAGVKYPMGMELRDTGAYGFLLPADQIIPTAEEVIAFHKVIAREIALEARLGEQEHH